MKKIFLSLSVLISSLAIAKVTQTKRAQHKSDLDNARVVRISATIYRDEKNFDKDAWDKTIDETASIIELGAQEGKDVEFLEGVVRSIQEVYKRGSQQGIHAEIKVGVGDGGCGCGEGCDCASKYKGLCPCSATGDKSCQGESVKCRSANCGHK
jgi:hypothetical protein